MRAIRAATVAMMLLCSSTECAPCDGTESDGECMVPAAAALVQANTQRRQVEQMNDTALDVDADALVNFLPFGYIFSEKGADCPSGSTLVTDLETCKELAAAGRHSMQTRQHKSLPHGCLLYSLNMRALMFNTDPPPNVVLPGPSVKSVESICKIGKFVAGPAGSAQCSTGSIPDAETCKAAAAAGQKRFGKVFTPLQGHSDVCFVLGEDDKATVNFGSSETVGWFLTRDNVVPVCMNDDSPTESPTEPCKGKTEKKNKFCQAQCVDVASCHSKCRLRCKGGCACL